MTKDDDLDDEVLTDLFYEGMIEAEKDTRRESEDDAL